MHGVRVLSANDTKTRSAVEYLKDLLLCRLRRRREEVGYLTSKAFYMKENALLKQRCRSNRRTCFNASFVEGVCRGADLHLAKVLRLSLRWLRPLLEDDDLDFQVIYLVRDPRAVLSSRTKVPWCRSPSCRNPKVVCSLLTEDLTEVPALLKAYPQR
ncbi:uncharacterized protein [Penaeus vannamei]|uniref:uncharacterized protein n=1 Tax=Penaeus vannamei TaxID=6689 RepID=UPI00387F7D1E